MVGKAEKVDLAVDFYSIYLASFIKKLESRFR
jgi:hypothetical protein